MTDLKIPRRMRAALLTEYGKPYLISETDVPAIKEDELLIKVYAAGFCHSDLQVLQGQFGTKLPMIPSHEPAGVIVRVGSKCNPKWKIGSRVGVLNYRGTCSQCSGCGLAKRQLGGLDPRFCENRETSGFHHDGAFAEYMVADPQTTVLIPDGISFEQAAPLMCAGATVWASLEKATAGLTPGEPVGIIGIGGLGYLGIQFAKSLGYRTIAIDSRESSRQLARDMNNSLQPDMVLDSSDEQMAASQILQVTNGEGLAAVVVCTDSIEANAWALTLLRIGGSLGVLGLPLGRPWMFDPSLMAFRELTIRGSYVAGKKSTEKMMEMVVQHGIQSDLTIVPFGEIPNIANRYQQASFKGRLVARIAE